MASRDYGDTMGLKLVEIKDPVVPPYLKGVLEGIEAGYRLGVMMAYFCEGYDGEKLSRLLSEVTGGRNSDALTIKSSTS